MSTHTHTHTKHTQLCVIRLHCIIPLCAQSQGKNVPLSGTTFLMLIEFAKKGCNMRRQLHAFQANQKAYYNSTKEIN